MKLDSLTVACAWCALALAVVPVLATEPGNLMKITTTTRMHMSGMPNMAPVTRTDKVCTSAKKPDVRDMLNRNKMCKITDFEHAGNTISYHMTCSGETQMRGDGKFTLLAGGGIHGRYHASGTAGGHSMSMDLTEDGTRIGSCDYTPPKTR